MNLTYIYLIIVMSYCILILLIPRQPQEVRGSQRISRVEEPTVSG